MPTKKTALIMSGFIFLMAIASSANLAGAAVEWTPLVRIPGLPSTGTVNLSMYLIGLYNFLLSIVGIVAVIMLIIGGMRYITAVGNPTAISDAKDIIYSAITGLLLALLSWVFISTINPDVLFIKQPGSGAIDPALNSRDMSDCELYPPCPLADSPCILPGSPVDKDSFESDPGFNKDPYNGKCQCVNGAFVELSAETCQESCAKKNCVVADLRVGVDASTPYKTIAVPVGQTIYLDARYSRDYNYTGDGNGISRYEIDYDDDDTVIRDYACSDDDDTVCGNILAPITGIIWGNCGATKRSYSKKGTYKIKLIVKDKSNCNKHEELIEVMVY